MTARHAFITEHVALYPLRLLCRLLGVARSWYLARAARLDDDRPESGREGARRSLLQAIRRIFKASRGTYGAPRIHAELHSEGMRVSRKTVAKLMKQNGISPPRRKKRRPVTTDSNHRYGIAPNLLEPIQRHRPPKGLIQHSDRGVQYASKPYRKILADHGIKASMSRKGDCLDNAPMESFFGSLKTELVHRTRFKTREEARRAIFEYIEVWYNRQRRHSSLGAA